MQSQRLVVAAFVSLSLLLCRLLHHLLLPLSAKQLAYFVQLRVKSREPSSDSVWLCLRVCVCVALHNFHANAQAALKRSATKVHSPRALHSPRLFLFLPRPLSLSRLALC